MIKNKYEKIRLRILVAICIGVILTTLIGLLISTSVVNHFDEDYLSKQMKMSQAMYQQSLADDTETLSGVITLLQKDRVLQDLFLAGDRAELLTQSEDIFRQLRDSYRITHFYYHKLNGQNFLRVHSPNRYGDQIERITMQQAMTSQALSSGIELGPLGTFTLRVVMPWLRDGKTIGYLELGEEIEHITQKISSLMQIELVLVIHKRETNRKSWLQGQQLLGRNGDWNLLKNYALLNTSFSVLPSTVRAYLQTVLDTGTFTPGTFQVNKNLIASASSLKDASNRDLGYFLVFVDVSDSIRDLHKASWEYVTYSLLLLVFMMIGYWAYLGRIEEAICFDRKKLSETLKKQENILSSMAEGFVMSIPAGGKIIQTNTKMKEMLGLSTEKIIGCKISDFITMEDLPTAKGMIELLTKGKQARGELSITSTDQKNTPCLVTASPMFDDEGIVIGSFSTWNDITEYKQTVNRLLETEKNFNHLFHNANDAITLMRDGMFTDCNEKQVEMLGAANMAQVLQCSPERVSPERQPDGQLSRDKVQEMIAKAMETGFHRFEWMQKKLNGECFPTEISLTPLSINGEAVFHSISKDLSQQKQFEQDLQNAADNAIASSRSKDEFLANMSHEIRTPMNGIIGLTRLTLDTELTAKQRQMLDNVLYSAENLLGLLNDILDFSKIEAGQLLLEDHNFNLEAMLNRIISTLHFQAQEKRLFLVDESDYTTLPTFIQTDELRLRQVIINLIGNGIKFTQTGGITINVFLDRQQGDEFILHFSVADTGIGIPSDKEQSVFNSFTQANTSTAREYGGTGLGLAISRQLIELMGGEIWFESAENKGTIFHFTTRVQLGTAESLPQTNHSLSPIVKNLRILLVEDNAFNQDIAVAVFEKDGHQVEVAADGMEALKALVRDDWDVIFMDVQMPVLDGLTATGIIRRCEAGIPAGLDDTLLEEHLLHKLSGKHTPIIAMTANAMSGDRNKCLDAGMDEYLTKPFMPEHIHRILHLLFNEEEQETHPTQIQTAGPRSTEENSGSSLTEQVKKHLKTVYSMDDGQALQMMQGAADSLQESLSDLEDAFATKNASALQETAHSIKGALLNMGLQQLSEQAAVIEKNAADNTIPVQGKGYGFLITSIKLFIAKAQGDAPK